MFTRVSRWLGLLVPAIVILVTLAAAACGGGDPEELTIPVKVEGENLVPDTVKVKHRDMVTLRIESATRGEFHLHGYDIEREVKGGEVTDFYFVADVEGRFRIAFHELAGDGPATEGDAGHDEDEGHEDEEHGEDGEVEIGVLEVRPR